MVVNDAGLSRSKPLLETMQADWGLRHDVMAKGFVPGLARRGLRALIDQTLGGDIVQLPSKNSVFAGQHRLVGDQSGFFRFDRVVPRTTRTESHHLAGLHRPTR